MPELLHERLQELARSAGYFQLRERLAGDGFTIGLPAWASLGLMTLMAARRRCPRCAWRGLILQPYLRAETLRVLHVCPACSHARLY